MIEEIIAITGTKNIVIIAPAKNMDTSPVIHFVPGGTAYIAYAVTPNDKINPDTKLKNALSAKVMFVRLLILFTENMICQIGAANKNNKRNMIEGFTINTILLKR